MTITGVLGIFEPKITLLELPFLFRDRTHIQKGQQSEAVQKITASLPAKGVRLEAVAASRQSTVRKSPFCIRANGSSAASFVPHFQFRPEVLRPWPHFTP